MDWSRRRALAVAAALAGGLAGCTGAGDDESPPPTEEPTGTPDDGTPTATPADEPPTDEETPTETPPSEETPSEDLDLREANVTQVEVAEAESDGEYQFRVTLYHDDDGEDGYADWWQVETLDGERLGRRELTHPHGTGEYAHAELVSVPEDVTCVVVRGHDQTHSYGGQAMLVTVDSGATRAVDQGSEPASFADATCPE
ncbi:hypothetical protein BRC81_09225 [Halobacteriales archaeon QS_1_68_20]|nr:MAG: hypothetical protein BRC81_09225 [Halobacteriales archaeon QS_1_68_20]